MEKGELKLILLAILASGISAVVVAFLLPERTLWAFGWLNIATAALGWWLFILYREWQSRRKS